MKNIHRLTAVVSIFLVFTASFVFISALLRVVNAKSINVSVEVISPECSDGIDNDGNFQTDYPDDPECSSETDNNENVDGTEIHTTSTVTTSGGSHSFDNLDGLAVDFTFPGNFHGSSTRLFANSYSNSFFESEKPAPSGKSFIGKTYEFLLFDENTFDAIATTTEPVTIILRYSENDVENIDESSLGPYRHDSTSWQLISDGTIDTANNELTFSTTEFSSFAVFGEEPAEEEAEPAPSGNGGGGGGGGTTTVSPTTIVLKGHAYPKSAVTILVNGKILNTVTANSSAFWSGKFKVEPESHTFGVYSADKKGRRSLTYTFSLSPSKGTTSIISGIFIAPTIDTDKTQVRKGETIKFSGQTTPSSTVTIFVNSEKSIKQQVPVSETGAYLLNFDSNLLDYGNHTAKSRSLLNDTFSSVSNSISFKVDTKTVIKKPPGDLSGDGRVNIVDFSILFFWWENTSTRAFDMADVNGDKRVDIRDLSILLFYWTG